MRFGSLSRLYSRRRRRKEKEEDEKEGVEE